MRPGAPPFPAFRAPHHMEVPAFFEHSADDKSVPWHGFLAHGADSLGGGGLTIAVLAPVYLREGIRLPGKDHRTHPFSPLQRRSAERAGPGRLF